MNNLYEQLKDQPLLTKAAVTDHWIVEFRSRETGNLFTKGFLGTRQEVEAYHRDIQVELDALLVSVSLDLSE